MAKKAQSPKQQTAVKLFIWVLILLAVAGLLIVPQFMKNSKLKKEIVQAQNELKQAEMFSDAYAELLIMEDDQKKKFQRLILPEPDALTTENFEEATGSLIELIKESNLSPPEEGFEILSGSLGDYENQVLVTAEFTGDFTDAWGFFVELGGLPYVQHVQGIDIEDRFEIIACRMALRLQISRSE